MKDNGRINQSSLQLESALSKVPKSFRNKLIKKYVDLKTAFAKGQHEVCGLNAGKYCEVMLRFLQDNLTGDYSPFNKRINLYDECVKLRQLPQSAGHESFRIIIPMALSFVYTIRNKRGIGHIGGEVDANAIDAATCVRVTDWCMCELIRVVHTLPIEGAQDILDSISARQLPQVWSVLGRKRVLDHKMDYPSKTLLLLWSEPDYAVPSEDLFCWTGHSNKAIYKRDVLRTLHKRVLVEYDEESEMVVLSPKGIKQVEEKLVEKVI